MWFVAIILFVIDSFRKHEDDKEGDYPTTEEAWEMLRNPRSQAAAV